VAKASKECIDEAFSALKNFTREELDDYVQDVFTRARSYDNLQNMRAFDRAMKEINDERLKSYFDDATTKANNIMKFERSADALRKGKLDVRGLLAARGNYLAQNISNAQKAELEKIIKRVLGDLTHEEVEHFSSGNHDEAITDAFDGKKINDPLAQKIADKLKDYFIYRNAELILSNAMKFDEINEDRLFRAIHDQEKIINAGKSLRKIATERVTKKYDLAGHKTQWRNFIKKFLDMDGTFSRTKAVDLDGNLDMREADKILDRIFDNITTGKSTIFTRSVVANDREAVAKKSRMFFKWQGLRAQYEYNKTYGRGNLFNMLMMDTKATANKVGVAKLWGDNPYTMYNDLRKVQEEVKPQGQFWWRNTDLYFKSVMGLDKASQAPTLTNFMSNLRTLSTMARLPFIAIDSISDVGYIASFAQRMGINYSRAWLNQMAHIFDFFPTEERQRIAKLFKIQVDSHLGYMGRWTENNNASDFLNKISTKYFKRNGLEAFDRGNKVGMMHLMAKHLYENSDKKFSDLNPALQKWVGKFLDENEWNLLRKKNQNGLFTTENVDNLTDQQIKSHYESGDKLLPLSEVRDDLYRKVHSMFTVASENAVLSPSEFEKVWLLQGQAPGTIPGEMLRLFTHFKMYTMAYIDRVLLRGYKEADTASQKLMWATSMLMGTIPLSVMSTFFHNLSQGLSMPNYNQMNVPEREKYLLGILAPSLAIFSGMLDPRNQNSSMIWSLLGSPSTSLIGNAMAAPLALAEGDPKRAGKKLADAAGYIFPIQTTPLISPIIRQAMGDEAHLDPGQTHYFGR
jgi:hypothetical protein